MAGSSSPKVNFRLCLVTDRKLIAGGGLVETVSRAVDGGVDAVVLREKDLGGRELFELGETLQERITGRAELIINDRADVAMALGSGIHLPGSGLSIKDTRRLLGEEKLIGVSVHSLDEVRQAEKAGADYIFFGPVCETASKKGTGDPQGLDRLKEAAASTSTPLFAIGGIGPARAAECAACGSFGVAFISFVLSHPHPGEAARSMKEAIMKGYQQQVLYDSPPHGPAWR